MKKTFTVFIIIALFFPNLALGAWWNPFSWNIARIFEPIVSIFQRDKENNVSEGSAEEIEKLRVEIEELKATQRQEENNSKRTAVNNHVPQAPVQPIIDTAVPASVVTEVQVVKEIPTPEVIQPTEPVDQYGMTEAEWVHWHGELDGIRRSIRDRRNRTLNDLRTTISGVESQIDSVVQALSLGLVQGPGIRLAEKHLETSQNFKISLEKALRLENEHIDHLSWLVNAIEDRNGNALNQSIKSLDSSKEKLDANAIEVNTLSPIYREAVNAYFHYVETSY